jgi:hypothetical protein
VRSNVRNFPAVVLTWWRSPRADDPAKALTGLVLARLEPRGLVEANGVVVPAWWVRDGSAPEPGTVVHRRPDREGRGRRLAEHDESER